MRKMLAFCFLVAIIATTIVFAESYPPLKQPGQPSAISTTFPAAIGSFQDNWQGTKAIYVFNSSGGSLAAGDLLIWDNTVTAVVDTYDASAAGSGTYDTCTIADSVKTFAWNNVYVYFSSPSNDTVVITGTDSANATQTETIVKASGAGDVYSTNYWRKVDLAYVTSSAANIGINFIPYAGVKTTTTAGDRNIAGIAAGTYADDSLMKIYIAGFADVKLAGATTAISPGAPLIAHSTVKYGIPSADIVPCFGYALGSGNTNASYLCFISPTPFLRYKYGADAFAGTKTADTVLVSGVETGDHVFVTPIGSAAWTTAPTGNVLAAGSIVVYCAEADTAIATSDGYNWLVMD